MTVGRGRTFNFHAGHKVHYDGHDLRRKARFHLEIWTLKVASSKSQFPVSCCLTSEDVLVNYFCADLTLSGDERFRISVAGGFSLNLSFAATKDCEMCAWCKTAPISFKTFKFVVDRSEVIKKTETETIGSRIVARNRFVTRDTAKTKRLARVLCVSSGV